MAPAGDKPSPNSAPPARPQPYFPLRLLLFGIAALVAVAIGFLIYSPAEAGSLVQRYGYFAMWGTFLWWLLSLRRFIGEAVNWMMNLSVHQQWQTGGLIAGLTVVAACIFPFSHKVLYDELALQSTAWNLHFFREVGTVVRGHVIEGVFSPLDVYLDKRPYFFTFLVALAHDLTGYRVANAFGLNLILLPVLLALFYVIARKLASHGSALAGLACFGASPLLAQNANGAGMELLNLAMLLLTMLLAARYLELPAETRLSALILSCVLLAQSRYESALFVVAVAFVVIEGWRRARRVILPPAAILAPVLLVPCALHQSFLSGTPELWELRENMDSRFAWEHFAGNVAHAGIYFFDLSRKILNSWWLSVVGWMSLVAGLVAIFRRVRNWKRAPVIVLVSIVFGGAVFANLLLLMLYFWGQLEDPIVSRLILPFCVILALAIVWATEQAAKRWNLMRPRIIVTGALISYLALGLPAAAYHGRINQLGTELEWELRTIKKMPPASRLLISNKTTLQWMLERMPAISIQRARLVPESVRVNLENGTFNEVLVSQLYRPAGPDGGFQVDPRDRLPDSYILEPVIERHIGARIVRISRVVKVEPGTVEADQSDAEKPIGK